MNTESKKLLITAGIFGFLGVVLGAFAAHGLSSILTKVQLESFQTGVRYQFYHTFLLLLIGISDYFTSIQKKNIRVIIITGILLFSGSIYVLNLDEYVVGTNFKAIALLTPLGGLFLIAAWLYITIISLRKH